MKGKTYSLFGDNNTTDEYYRASKGLTNLFLQRYPDEKGLLVQIQKAGGNTSFLSKLSDRHVDKSLISFIKKTLQESLSVYTPGIKQHLKTLPLSQRLDGILRTKEDQYHLYMLEIESDNRIYYRI